MTTGPSNLGLAASRHARYSARRGGFTLLELIIVLLVISVVLAIASPSLRGFFASRKTAEAACKVVTLARFARGEAAARGELCRLTIDPDRRSCRVTTQHNGTFSPLADGPDVTLPEGATMSLRSSGLSDGEPYIEFHPTGRSDVTTVEIRGPKGELFLVGCESPGEQFRVLPPAEVGAP